MKHLDVTGGQVPICGQRARSRLQQQQGEAVTQHLDEVDCEGCLWRALADVQNGLTLLLQRLHIVTKQNRIQVINPVANKGESNG